MKLTTRAAGFTATACCPCVAWRTRLGVSSARQSFRNGVDTAFEARLVALSTTHNLLTRAPREGAELTEIAATAASP
ncbi:HWE histidine kinase domain-containing protein [Microvirga subterranea]|uniref:histidine kinase n=1 Tax=Microvirga subterranea TaxID=186651 RepID=A0A370HHW9_9HYPH|nr:HWE histidine kinase [Microvirga subterranea]